MAIDFAEVTTSRDRVAVVATEPLTRDEIWHQGTPGSMWVFSGGLLRATLPSGERRPPAAAARRGGQDHAKRAALPERPPRAGGRAAHLATPALGYSPRARG